MNKLWKSNVEEKTSRRKRRKKCSVYSEKLADSKPNDWKKSRPHWIEEKHRMRERGRAKKREKKVNRKTYPRIKATTTTMLFDSSFIFFSLVFFLFKNSTECFELPFLYAMALLCVSLCFTHSRVSSILALSSLAISVCLLCIRR